MTQRDLMSRMSSSEYVEWQRLEALEPFGDRRADLHAGIIAATIANVNRRPETAAFKPSDFMPNWDLEVKPEQPANNLLAAFLAFKDSYERRQQKLQPAPQRTPERIEWIG